MSPRRFFFAALLMALAAFAPLRTSSQTATSENMGASLAVGDTVPPTWRFSWWGRSGRHYVIQVSTDLQAWSYLPGLNPSGADAPLTVAAAINYDPSGAGANSAEPRLFFRAVEFDPASPPAAGNTLPDQWEKFYFGAPETNPAADPDHDGLTNLQEYQHGTDPTAADTDGDGLPDGWEVAHNLNPKSLAGAPSEAALDPDHDGLTNLKEYLAGSDPHQRDTDGDGLPDGLEASLGSDPAQADSAIDLVYFPKFLPLPAGTSDAGAIAISNTGILVGYASSASVDYAARWTEQSAEKGQVSGSNYTFANAVNDAGVAVGDTNPDSGYNRAMHWPVGSAPARITGPLLTAMGEDINNHGLTVGTDNDIGAFIRDAGGALSSLPLPAGYQYNSAFAVNDDGVIVGRAQSAGTGEWRGVRWVDGSASLLPAATVQATDVNAAGDIVGPSTDGVFLLHDGALTALPAPPGGHRISGLPSYHLNLAGMVLGPNANYATTLWLPSADGPARTPRLLSELLLTDEDPYYFSAYGLNDRGDLAGEYYDVTSGTTQPVHFQATLRPRLLVDADRDGQIRLDSSDATTAATPFRFWVNDDIDRGHAVDGDDFEEDDLLTSPTGKLDWQENRIPSKRDLEDYFRLWINVSALGTALKSGELFLGLKWTNVTGTPAVKLYPHFEAEGGLGYLTDETTATQQINGSLSLGQFNLAIADQRDPTGTPMMNANPTLTLIEGSVGGTQVFILPTWLFANLTESTSKICLLAEGCKPGQGQLQPVILRKDGENYLPLGDGPGVWLDLKSIDDMYERWTAGDASGGAPWASALRKKVQLSSTGEATGHAEGFAYAANAPEESKYILYVHGWNMQPWEKNRFAETAFKRLYWQGYKGRFGVFCWPTTYGFESDFDAVRDNTNYDRGEWAAWRTAAPLKNLLVALHGTYGSQVYIVAHSMGNVVAGEALQLASLAGTGKIVNTYVASQAALPAHVYDGGWAEDLEPDFSAITNIARNFDGSTFPQTPNIYRGWLTTNGDAVATRINFYNENDYALWHDVWELNQFFKPDQPDAPNQPFTYRFFGDPQTANPNSFAKLDQVTMPLALGDRINLGDRYEIMAFAAEARSKAVGAAASNLTMERAINLQGVDSSGQRIWPNDDQSVKLHNGLSYSAHKWHSAQFRSTIVRQQGYWKTLLGSSGFNIIMAP